MTRDYCKQPLNFEDRNLHRRIKLQPNIARSLDIAKLNNSCAEVLKQWSNKQYVTKLDYNLGVLSENLQETGDLEQMHMEETTKLHPRHCYIIIHNPTF